MKRLRLGKAKKHARLVKESAIVDIVGGIFLIILSAFSWGLVVTAPPVVKEIFGSFVFFIAIVGFLFVLDGVLTWYRTAKIIKVLRELAE